MLDLMSIHEEITKVYESGEITLEEAESLYDKMYEEQVSNLILDIYDAFTEGYITDSECNTYISILTEASKEDKITGLDSLPEKERKEVEDSIKKAYKEAGKVGNADTSIAAINGIDKVVKKAKSKKK